MDFKLYANVHDFYAATFDILMQSEAQNIIPLGNIMTGVEGIDKTDWRDPSGWLMATVSAGGGIILTALMTPPHKIVLYATDNKINIEAIHCLIDGLAGHVIPGVTCESALSECFAGEYCAKNAMTYKPEMHQRIYELTAVNPKIPQIGSVRPFNEDDMHFFPFWMEAFHAADVYGKTEMNIPQKAEKYQYRIDSKNFYVLEVDGRPVSMAGYPRQTPNSAGVAMVFTPPYYRGRGYASSVVAQISRLALDRGFKRCVLYTDLKNPTSNSIYQKIGYVPVCNSTMFAFE